MLVHVLNRQYPNIHGGLHLRVQLLLFISVSVRVVLALHSATFAGGTNEVLSDSHIKCLFCISQTDVNYSEQ